MKSNNLILKIRAYQKEDKREVLNLFQRNVPEFFHADEMQDLSNYLDHEIDQYFVVAIDSKIVGAGGINFENGFRRGKISWDIIHPDYHGKGIGSSLLQHRLHLLLSTKSVEKIIVRTSQLAYLFYEKNNFKTTEIIKDYWAPGFDLYYMVYEKQQKQFLNLHQF